ncbi:nucleotidyltransferase family protein (plasmid) [Streptomyces sp. NBC_01278]|uniref:hypothetical protein n=1 Tax=unclassified Streptomyces TaxID=2593676 RepID=UPI002E0F5DC6|nr:MULTISPECIES: hypothetical protein [unclassified Streptomyces]WSR29176.1 nucleotidyltransferase family protein [Streptomyces sp. NBC_01205]
MTPDHRSNFPLTLDLLYELLDVAPELPVRRLLQAARQVRGVLAPLVLSLAEREGIAMGTGARDELARMRRRAETYRQLAEDTARVPGARVVKGPSLARHYPEGALRALGDLDVVVPGEAALWQVLALALDRHDSDEVELTELGAQGRPHLFAAVWWLGEDPLLDPDHGIEVTTFGFAGRPGLVPLRASLPEDQVLADVLSLAEERFQRPFTAKDIIDLVCVLTSPAAPAPRTLIAAAEEFALAPELLELCERVRAYPRLAATVPDELIEGLRGPADTERGRRADPQAAPVEQRYGMQLTVPLRRGEGTGRCEHRWNDGVITRTPVADFLMVPGELVDPALHAAALQELAGLAPWPLRPARTTAPHPDGEV